MTLVARLRNSELRLSLGRFSLNPATLCLMELSFHRIRRSLFLGTVIRQRTAHRRRWGDQPPVRIDAHTEQQAHVGENLFDLVERLAAEVLGTQHLGLGLLYQFPNGLDVGVLE